LRHGKNNAAVRKSPFHDSKCTISGDDMHHFSTQNAPYRSPKWGISQRNPFFIIARYARNRT
jgi:hypothetical protein